MSVAVMQRLDGAGLRKWESAKSDGIFLSLRVPAGDDEFFVCMARKVPASHTMPEEPLTAPTDDEAAEVVALMFTAVVEEARKRGGGR